MVEPLVTFELRKGYLLVVGHGRRDDLASMVTAASQIYKRAAETSSRHLLVDYRHLEINVRLGDAFNIVKQYEASLPGLKDITVAAAFEPAGIEFGRYWKSVGRQRGFFIEIFDNLEVAEEWLLQRIASQE